MGRVTGFEPAGEPAFRLPSRQRPIVRASGAKRPLVQLARRKKESPYSLRNTDLKYRNSIDANASRFLPKTKSQPSAAGSIWKGGARERADDVFFAIGIKRRRSKADFAPTWKGRLKSIFLLCGEQHLTSEIHTGKLFLHKC